MLLFTIRVVRGKELLEQRHSVISFDASSHLVAWCAVRVTTLVDRKYRAVSTKPLVSAPKKDTPDAYQSEGLCTHDAWLACHKKVRLRKVNPPCMRGFNSFYLSMPYCLVHT